MKTLLKFEADWCAPCQMLKPILEKTLTEFPDVKLKCINIDDSDGADLVVNYGIKSVPTLILLDEGEDTKRLVGLVNQEKIREFLSS